MHSQQAEKSPIGSPVTHPHGSAQNCRPCHMQPLQFLVANATGEHLRGQSELKIQELLLVVDEQQRDEEHDPHG